MEYPSNSKKVKQVTAGVRTEKKKNIVGTVSDSIFGEQARNILKYVVFDVLIPAAKDTLSEMTSMWMSMMLYGEPRSRNRDRDRRGFGQGHTSYSNYYGRPRQTSKTTSRGHDLDEIVIPTRAEAEEVLTLLNEMVDQYGTTSVGDFYDLCGITGEFTDNRYGWDNLRNARVLRVREGYVLDLPKPIVLD